MAKRHADDDRQVGDTRCDSRNAMTPSCAPSRRIVDASLSGLCKPRLREKIQNGYPEGQNEKPHGIARMGERKPRRLRRVSKPDASLRQRGRWVQRGALARLFGWPALELWPSLVSWTRFARQAAMSPMNHLAHSPSRPSTKCEMINFVPALIAVPVALSRWLSIGAF